MEIKSIIKRVITISVLISVCFLLQTSVFSNLELAGVTPNLLIVVTSSFGFMRGRKTGMLVGFFCGFVIDLFFGANFGIFALIYMYIGYINGFFRKIFFGDDIKLPMLLIAASDLMYGLLNYLVKFIMDQDSAFGFYFFNVIIPEVMYTVVIAIFLYFLIYQLNRWLDKSDKRSDRNLV